MRTKALRCLVAVLFSALMATSAVATSAQAAGSERATTEVNPVSVIAKAKHDSPKSLAEKVAILRKSDALMDLFVGSPDSRTTNTYLEFFAAISTIDQVRGFVEKTAGKHFVASGPDSNPTVTLEDGLPISARGSCCKCWKARVASIAYFAASGLTCAAVGAMTGAVGGFVCGGVFYAMESLPNFDAACK